MKHSTLHVKQGVSTALRNVTLTLMELKEPWEGPLNVAGTERCPSVTSHRATVNSHVAYGAFSYVLSVSFLMGVRHR